MKVPAVTGEPEVAVLERIWARPTLEVHGIRGGFTGEGAKTVIPARAVAKSQYAAGSGHAAGRGIPTIRRSDCGGLSEGDDRAVEDQSMRLRRL